jgi:hypothetical protein
MKSLFKPMLLCVSFSAIVLSSAYTYASPDVNKSLDNQPKNYPLMFALPHLESEGMSKQNRDSTIVINNLNKSLLPKSSPTTPRLQACKTKRKTSLYELTAIFNDKLQLFIDYLDKPKKLELAKQDKKKNKQVIPNSAP